MTNSNGRIDRIEALAEENERKISNLLNAIANQQQQINNQQQQINSLAVVAQQTNVSLLNTTDSTQQQINAVVAAVQQTSNNLQQLSERTDNRILRLAEIIESEREERLKIMNSIQAELDRQGRILDYLLGQQGQQPT